MNVPRNDHVLDFVDAYLHSALEEDDLRFVEQHCEECSICGAALHEAQKRFETLQVVAPSEAPESLIQATLTSIENRVERRKRNWRIYRYSVLAVLAASVLIVASLHVHYDRMRPTPYDLRILGQARWLAGSTSTLRLAVYDQRTGLPVSNVPARLSLRDRNTQEVVQLASFVTDDGGEEIPRFQLPEWDDGRYDLLFTANLDGQEETLQQPVRLRRTWKLMLSTDKPLYQPGQTIHVRSMSLRQPDLKPLADQKAVFEITDSKGNMIFKKEATTSEFGIAHADCVLASELNLGTYTVKCRMNDTTAKRTVDVSHYVLPKFRVAVTSDRPYYQPSQVANVIVDAQYFFGKPVAGGQVELQVFGEAAGLFEIDTIEKELDADGKATFSFRLPDHFSGRPQNQGDASIQFFAKVTNSAGLQYSKQLKRIVTNNQIHIEVIPESPQLTPGVANRVYLYTSYADGRPAQTKVVVHGIADDLQTTPLGVATFSITPGTDPTSLTIRATDSTDQRGYRKVELKEGSPETIVLRTNKAVYDGGETMTVQCLGAGVEPVFVDFVKEDQSLLTVQVEMNAGRGQAELELPPEVFGPVQIVAHRFNRQGLAIHKSRAIFVRQPKALQIKATMDSQVYRPGETAKVKFSVTDDDGKAVPSALSLAIVDEALFSVMDQAAGMEKVFFLLENELLKPVYAIYNWTPDWSSDVVQEEREMFEQALFSRTATETARKYSLTAVSFPAKQASVNKTRNNGLQLANRAWISLLCFWTLVAVGTFAVAKPKWFFVLFGGTVVLFFCLAIPATFLLYFVTLKSGRGVADMAEMAMDLAVENSMAPMAAMDPGMAMPTDSAPAGTEESPAPTLPTIRQRFPETLLWNPELITDAQGMVELEVPLADSITTWRITASSVSAGGQLGAEQFPLKVFQPFFVDVNSPYSLTRNDEVDLQVAVYNYLNEPQTVEIKMDEADWFEWRAGNDEQDLGKKTVELQPNEILGVSFPIRVLQAGKQFITVTALAGDAADAVKRPITILPGGERIDHIVSGTLGPEFSTTLNLPPEAIENSVTAYVKIYPSAFSELVEGLDNIFQMPGGCFEQTSSTTYPNILALDYLRKTNKSIPEMEAKARQYIHVGYQRLVSFEVNGGGFDWFGNPPANITLTAYGLMEFEDMAAVYDVDPKLINRTRDWLLRKRQPDGSWQPISQGINDGLLGSVHRGGNVELAMTAYVARAVFNKGAANGQAAATLDYLLAHPASSIDNPYLLATIAGAVASIDAQRPELAVYYERLTQLKKISEDGKRIWWEQGEGNSTMFYGSGRSGDIETTALVAQALMRSGSYPAVVNGALTWIVEQKDERGTWHSTQATVLALQALIQAAGGGTESVERQIELTINGNVVEDLKIPTTESEVVKHISLSRIIEPGEHELSVRDVGDSGANFQLVFAYHVPADPDAEASSDPATEPLNIEINYDRTRLNVNEHITATAIVINQLDEVAPMVILDLPIPGGFELERGELDELVGSKLIEKYQITPRKAIIYLRELAPGRPLQLRYRLKATMPVKVQAAPAEAYQYYDPDKRGKGEVKVLEALAT